MCIYWFVVRGLVCWCFDKHCLTLVQNLYLQTWHLKPTNLSVAKVFASLKLSHNIQIAKVTIAAVHYWQNSGKNMTLNWFTIQTTYWKCSQLVHFNVTLRPKPLYTSVDNILVLCSCTFLRGVLYLTSLHSLICWNYTPFHKTSVFISLPFRCNSWPFEGHKLGSQPTVF